VVEALIGGVFTAQWADASAYVLLVLVLMIRPTGLLGKADAV
jgi:branched-chain amino acid transport system permease protein